MNEVTESALDQVQIFNSEVFGAIRTAGTPEQPMFCLTDVCKVLDLSAKEVNRRLSDGVVTKHPISDSLGRTQMALFVNEDGLYDVILDSRKPEAKAFRKWVTSEVLPAIRKQGGYMVAQADESPEQLMARALKIADDTLKRREQQLQMAQSTIEEQEREIKELSPMADYTREVLQSTSTFTLTQISKDLQFRSVYAFTNWAFDKGLIYRQSGQWMPTAKVSGKGYFTTRTAKFVHSDNTIGTSISTVVTEQGRQYLHEILRKESAQSNTAAGEKGGVSYD